ncbi:hypothetical protein C1Y40_03872 [Mycobacterium talmoniae]|uniref:Uncharacterized protein n=1 Tax=Mycobacterium talmoniae TaxID=1858794 RepID=A0A2S8BH03_9MYCO|nr:hypothetical protein C1Y40_03872 [Mycobacterium talmoniae]
MAPSHTSGRQDSTRATSPSWCNATGAMTRMAATATTVSEPARNSRSLPVT